MDCKNCGNSLPDDASVCPYCAEPVETVVEDYSQRPSEKGKNKIVKIVLGAVVGVVMLAVAALLVIVVLASTVSNEDGKRVENPYSDMLAFFRANDINCRGCFSDDLEDALDDADEVIATIGNYELTNGQLQIYYWMQVYDYVEANGNFSFNYKEPLYEQYYSEEKDLSWEQHFIELAIETWSRYALINIMADNDGFELSAEDANYVTLYKESIEKAAAESGFKDAEEMVKTDFGGNCSFDDYIDYVSMYYFAGKYIMSKEAMVSPTMEQISAYYDKNADAFVQAGIAKKDKDLVAVRHILVQLKDSEKDAYRRVKYTDEQWEQCRLLAQEVLDAWLENPTEENFGELAKKHSVDGSASKGGLMTNVEQGMMVTAFNDWIFDDSRVKGDSGLVKTEFGYHVMYFVSREQKQGDWVEIAKTQLIADEINKMIEEAEEAYKTEVDYKDIVLAKKTVTEE